SGRFEFPRWGSEAEVPFCPASVRCIRMDNTRPSCIDMHKKSANHNNLLNNYGRAWTDLDNKKALIGNVDDVDAGSQLEQFGREAGGIAVAGRSVIELAWVGLGVGDERRHRLRWKCGVDDQHLMIWRNLRVPSKRCVCRARSSPAIRRPSVDLDAGLVRNRRPARCLGGDEGRKILRRADFRFRAQSRKACLRVLGSKDLVDRGVELFDDGGGVPAGASSPGQNERSSLGYPLSAVVGTPGSSGERASVATASARSRPPWTWGRRMAVVSKIICTWPARRSVTDWPAPR